jgi:hypothetical protein
VHEQQHRPLAGSSVGDPVDVAMFSFGSFAIGASIPLAPFGGEGGASLLAGLLGLLVRLDQSFGQASSIRAR